MKSLKFIFKIVGDKIYYFQLEDLNRNYFTMQKEKKNSLRNAKKRDGIDKLAKIKKKSVTNSALLKRETNLPYSAKRIKQD